MPPVLSEAAQADFPDGDRPTKKMRVDEGPQSPRASSDVVDEDDIYGESTNDLPSTLSVQKPATVSSPESHAQPSVQSPSTLPGLGTFDAPEAPTEAVHGLSVESASRGSVLGAGPKEEDGAHAKVSKVTSETSLQESANDIGVAHDTSSQPTRTVTKRITSIQETGNTHQLSSNTPLEDGDEIAANGIVHAPPLQEDSTEVKAAQQLLPDNDLHMHDPGSAKDPANGADQPMATKDPKELVPGEAILQPTNGDMSMPKNVLSDTDRKAKVASLADSTLPEANTGDNDKHAAEFEFDASDAESTDSSDTSDSDSSDGDDNESDDGDYPLLGPEEQARMLMAEGGNSDDEGPQRRPGAKSGPKTANEVKEVKVEKPNITVTPEMEILELGTAQNIVENYLLVRGTTSGETQVLESGSVLCLPDRIVIGAVAEPLGRVDTPMYSVAFTNPEDIAASGITIGCKIFYVKQHSSYVFTQPLKNMKYTDASNLHDEDVDDDEMEFSDDEAEAAYKRAKKQDKLAKKGIVPGAGGKSSGPPTHPGSTSSTYPDVPIKYDDEDGESLYTPLSRPDQNELPSKPVTSLGNAAHRAEHSRGRGDRGRGDRGRGHRGRERGRGGRGKHQVTRPALPPQEAVAPPQTYGGQAEYQRSPYAAPSYTQASNYWSPAPPAAGPIQPNPGFNPPPGSFVNPAFFQRQQQHAPFPQPQQYGAQQQPHYGVSPGLNQQQNFQYPQGQYPGGGFGYNQSRQWNG